MRMAMDYPLHTKFLNPYNFESTTSGDWTGASKYYGRAAPIPAFTRPGGRQRAIGGTPDDYFFEHYGYRANHAVQSYYYNIEQYL